MIYFIEATWLCNGPIKIGAAKLLHEGFYRPTGIEVSQ